MAWVKKTHPDPVVEDSVPIGMRIAGAFSWRVLVIAGVIALFVWLMTIFSDILVPFLVGIVISALLVPISNRLQRHHVPKWLAVILSLLGGLAAVAALLWLVIDQIIASYPSLRDRTVSQFGNVREFVLNSGFGISQADVDNWIKEATTWVQDNTGTILSGVASASSSATHVFEALFIILFTTIFLLIDGKNVWRWTVRLFPRKARATVDGAGVAGWITLTSFIRVQIFVAFVDAVGIGLGAFFLGLPFGGFPLVIPIAIAVFLGSFVPVVGAVLTGTVAIFVALVFLGPWQALIMLGIVLLVQQVEGHILQPLVMGTAVKVHPLAVVFAVAAGAGIAGIPGALFAVPLVATLNVMVTYIASGKWRETRRPGLKEATKQ
jgi:predicted PurR-regulated permease PerM